MNVDMYEYFASSNPFLAKKIIESFGYQITNRNMGQNLRTLVANEGEPALKAILDQHPDKDIILEVFGNSKSEESKKCSCSKSNSDDNYVKYMYASGQTEAKTLGMQTNTMLLASALILAVAIIAKK